MESNTRCVTATLASPKPYDITRSTRTGPSTSSSPHETDFADTLGCKGNADCLCGLTHLAGPRNLAATEQLPADRQGQPAHPASAAEEPALGAGPGHLHRQHPAWPPGPTHDQGGDRPALGRLPRRSAGPASPPHPNSQRPQDRAATSGPARRHRAGSGPGPVLAG